jgi:BNR repeat-like domain
MNSRCALTALAPVTFSCLLFASSLRAEDAAVYSTSFEDCQAGILQTATIGGIRLEATGTVSVTDAFARTGRHSLHLLGDPDNSLTFHLPKDLPRIRSLSFHAERWTVKSPFAFSVDVLQGDTWFTVARLDRVIEVGKRFRSHVQIAITDEAKAFRFRVTAPVNAGLLIDDLSLGPAPPAKPTRIPSESLPHEPLKVEENVALFVSGTQDTHTFRIPAIITAMNGDLIAACDARRSSAADLKPQRSIDIVLLRSSDNGKTWTPLELLEQIDDGGCSDPSLLLDRTTGDLFCFYNYMVRDPADNEFRFRIQRSSDDGLSWSKPVDFTDQVAGPHLKNSFKFITSGRGIQTRAGTLLHNFVRVGEGLTLFGSLDHGSSWKAISEVSPGDESKVVQLHDDSLMINSRLEPGKRFVHRSMDSGQTWTSSADWNLPDPQCNASIIQYTSKRDGYSKDRLVFCNAASIEGRKNLAARISYDGGATWSAGKVIDNGPAAYSEITILADGSIGVLYERGNTEIRFVRFTLEALTDGLDHLERKYQPTMPQPSRP